MNEKIAEKKKEIFDKHGWRCERCGQQATDLAHRIAKSKANRKNIYNYCKKEYKLELKQFEIDKIIHHELNLACSCKACNDYFNIGNKPEKSKKLLQKILTELEYIYKNKECEHERNNTRTT